MGLQQSKEELLYEQVSYGNVEGIKSLRSQGAGLEWIDREGQTPLIVACMNPGLSNVAKTLIELGANVNAYRPGRHAGTPLHHAAKRGLEETVNLLLSHGANALIMNDDCQSPLDVARAKGHSNVVRAIERHICLFSGWLREFYGPGFLEVLAPTLVSRKVWVVVLPCGSRKPTKPYKLELAMYSSLQDAQPRTVIGLWKVNLEEPKSHQSDPSVIIHDISSKTRIRLASGNENDKQQLQWFSNACKGIPQARPAFLGNNNPATPPPATAEDIELAMPLSASLQSASQERPPFPDANPTSGISITSTNASNLNGWSTSTDTGSYNGWGAPIAGASSNASSSNTGSYNGWDAPIAGASSKVSSSDWSGVQTGPAGSSTGHAISPTQTTSTSGLVVSSTQSAANPSAPPPSAPPEIDESLDEYPIQYPSIDDSPIDLSNPTAESIPPTGEKKGDKKGEGDSSSCVICLDAPVEGACIPCGHMAGCMSCLTEIKGKKWGCPVCRAKIEQVVRLYAV